MSGYQDCSSVLLDSCSVIAPCSICPKSDREILKFIICYDRVQTGGRGQGGAVRWDSTAAELVSREEQ